MRLKYELFKDNIVLLAILLAFVPVYSTAQKKEEFIIIGQVKGLGNGEKVRLKMDSGDKMIDLDSCVIYNEKFNFCGYIPGGPRLIRLFFYNQKQVQSRSFFLDNQKGTVYIQGRISNNLDKSISVDGSQAEYDLMTLNSMFYTSSTILDNFFWFHYGNLRRGHISYMASINDSSGFNVQVMNDLENLKDSIKADVKNLIMGKYSGNRAIPFLLYANFDEMFIGHDSLFKCIYARLDSETQSSYYGKLLQKRLYMCVGNPAPDFTSYMPNGQSLSLKQVLGKSKLTLVDFWNSGCWSCLMEFPRIVPLYKQYHRKGFNIISVSTDGNAFADVWKKNIERYNLSWYHVSSLKGYKEPVYNLYQVSAQPANVLIDHEGRILAWNVFGIELQWYLNKFLDGASDMSETKNE